MQMILGKQVQDNTHRASEHPIARVEIYADVKWKITCQTAHRILLQSRNRNESRIRLFQRGHAQEYATKTYLFPFKVS